MKIFQKVVLTSLCIFVLLSLVGCFGRPRPSATEKKEIEKFKINAPPIEEGKGGLKRFK